MITRTIRTGTMSLPHTSTEDTPLYYILVIFEMELCYLLLPKVLNIVQPRLKTDTEACSCTIQQPCCEFLPFRNEGTHPFE